jgi:hypothetical protein
MFRTHTLEPKGKFYYLTSMVGSTTSHINGRAYYLTYKWYGLLPHSHKRQGLLPHIEDKDYYITQTVRSTISHQR